MACHRIQSLNLAEMSAMFYKPMLSSHVKGCNLYNVLLLFLHFIQLLNTSWKKKSNNKVLSSPFGMWQNHQLMFSSTSVSRPVKLPRRFFFGGLPWKKTKNKKKQTQPHTGCPKWNFLRWAWVLHITQILSFTWRTGKRKHEHIRICNSRVYCADTKLTIALHCHLRAPISLGFFWIVLCPCSIKLLKQMH